MTVTISFTFDDPSTDDSRLMLAFYELLMVDSDDNAATLSNPTIDTLWYLADRLNDAADAMKKGFIRHLERNELRKVGEQFNEIGDYLLREDNH